MIFNILTTIYVFCCFLLILLVLLQKGKGSMGLGGMSHGTQVIFGGSGGQDVFQKATWILGAIFIGGSLVLSIMKTSQLQTSGYVKNTALPFQIDLDKK